MTPWRDVTITRLHPPTVVEQVWHHAVVSSASGCFQFVKR